jgi:ribosomal protein L37E
MLKIIEIAKAWIAAENPTPEQKDTAEYRITICEKCPHKSYNKAFDTYTCGLCGCPLAKKIFSPLPGEEACPDKRWKQ